MCLKILEYWKYTRQIQFVLCRDYSTIIINALKLYDKSDMLIIRKNFLMVGLLKPT